MATKSFVTVTESGPVVTKLTITCSTCHETSTLSLLTEGFDAWCNGALIQNAIPELDNSERELLISGTCGKCFDIMFPEEDEESS
jgi:hypothetical protein